MQKRVLLLLSFLCFIAEAGYSQDLKLLLRLNRSFGFNYEQLNYYGGNAILYSPGGGGGIEIGLARKLGPNTDIYGSLAYQQNLALQYTNINGQSQKSSFLFNRKTASLGLNHSFILSERWLRGFVLGGGLSYNFPGKLKIIEEDIEYGAIGYSSNPGYHADVKLIFELTEGLRLNPGLRYRNTLFFANSYEKGPISALPEKFRDLQASGVELSVTLLKELD